MQPSRSTALCAPGRPTTRSCSPRCAGREPWPPRARRSPAATRSGPLPTSAVRSTTECAHGHRFHSCVDPVRLSVVVYSCVLLACCCCCPSSHTVLLVLIGLALCSCVPCVVLSCVFPFLQGVHSGAQLRVPRGRNPRPDRAAHAGPCFVLRIARPVNTFFHPVLIVAIPAQSRRCCSL